MDYDQRQPAANRPGRPPVLTVSQLTGQIKTLVESSLPAVWVSGEISNYTRSNAGHCYFTLKDKHNQLRAVLWRTTAERLEFELKDGQQVIVCGNVEVYAPRGTYHLVVRHVLPQGIGARELALRQLKQRLAAEGLFDPRRKRTLPKFPGRVGLVTSPTGAAVHDFLEVLRRRFPGTDVVVIPTRVQGSLASAQIASAVRLANRLAERLKLDVLVVGRGGGSVEDLWCFNEEPVARAIFESALPVVSAVGHEIDVTLADLVADVRALTPSEAAERVVPAQEDLVALVAAQHGRMRAALARRRLELRGRLEAIAARRVLREPFARLREAAQQLDAGAARLERAGARVIPQAQRQLAHAADRLEALSPLSVLSRGYSVTRRETDGRIVRRVQDVQAGERIITRAHHARIVSRVEEVDEE